MFKCVIPVLLILALSGCNSESNKNRAFYYWKTTYRFSQEETNLSKELKINRLYIKYFDVQWSTIRNEAVPEGMLYFDYQQLFPGQFVPCVFISNQVMLKSTPIQLDTLAQRIQRKIIELSRTLIDYRLYAQPEIDSLQSAIPENPWPEIQIDCDWTEKSKENYFYFLKKIKALFPSKQVSSTLRLWQLKYAKKAGIPPVDRVMLMCYSTGNPREYHINNSIATYDELKKYLADQKYDLPVDFALPVFSWTVLFRNKVFKGIIPEINDNMVKTDTTLFKAIADNRYVFKSDTIIGSNYIRYGDELRIESLSQRDMNKLVGMLSKSDLYSKNSTIAFFSWDTLFIQNYGKQNIKDYFSRFVAE